MHEISQVPKRTWLRTDRPVVPTKTATWHYLPVIEDALQHGLFALADSKRPGFYEIEIGNDWYYLHIPARITGIYLIAAGRKAVGERLCAMTA